MSSGGASPLIGILSLQGDVREHAHVLAVLDAQVTLVRRPTELDGLDGLVLPGGESTAITRLARTVGLLDPLRAAIADGLPVLGTCAGLILLADHLADGAAGQETIGGLDVTVRRNAFGAQIASFETDLEVPALGPPPVRAAFIRAPLIEQVGPGGVGPRRPRGRAGGRRRAGEPAGGGLPSGVHRRDPLPPPLPGSRREPLNRASVPFAPGHGGDSRRTARALAPTVRLR